MNSSINETCAVPGLKVCTKCGVAKPGTAEFFLYTKKWLRSKCRLCRYEYQKEYRSKDQQKWTDYNRNKKREWRDNPDNHLKVLAANKSFWEKRKQTPKHRISDNIRGVMYHSLKNGKGGQSWTKLVDYNLKELMVHLERQFSDGMSWDNYGEWHIDHIVPLCSFDFDTPDHPDFKAAWALYNLRPLWAKDNKRKSGKREFLL